MHWCNDETVATITAITMLRLWAWGWIKCQFFRVARGAASAVKFAQELFAKIRNI